MARSSSEGTEVENDLELGPESGTRMAKGRLAGSKVGRTRYVERDDRSKVSHLR